MTLIHLEASEGLAVKSAGKVALISPVKVEVEVGLDMAGGFVLGGMVVTRLMGVRTCIEILGIDAVSKGFSGFRSGTMLLGS